LSALLGDPVVALEQTDPGETKIGSPLKGLRNLPVESLRPGRFQPRRKFDQGAIDDLVESVKEKGILQPILVRPLPEEPDKFEIIAGERRWRAAQAAMLHNVPAIVRALSDREALEVALIENLQRQDLSPLEEAEGYRRLMDDFSHTQEELAKTVGKSRSHVANTMRLLALPEPVKRLLDDGALTAGHARALLTAADPFGLAQQVIAKGLNVRQTEKLASQGPEKTKPGKGAGLSAKDADLLALERDLATMLGLKVAITLQGKGGEVAVHYTTLEQLDDILHRLSKGLHGRPAQPV
jgi:ParB family chromosome partitioning protein